MKQLTAVNVSLDMSPNAFGELRESNDCVTNVSRLRERMAEDGYLFFRDFLDHQWVLEARRQVVESLAKENLLDENYPPVEAVAARHARTGFTPEDRRFPAVRKLAHTGRMIDFYREFLGGEVRPYDYIWMRLMSPGSVTGSHYDIVYSGRGTTNLYTSWIPLGDIPLSYGPLMVLERSHLLENLKATYGRMDIDKNRNSKKIRFRHWRMFRGGSYSRNPKAVQRQFGLRWLTAEFRVGDVLIFTAFTMHGSLDNVSDRIRISVDTRYQLRSEPIDERWIGEHPIAHSQAE
jgi:ectoine hydroxylase-related dioxygenase (phytanoyl-CoA dioxygenase family)